MVSSQLGDLGTTKTLSDPASYAIQYGNLTANTAITIPAPVSGAATTVVLTQDPAGGWVPSLASSVPVVYPAGPINWVAAPASINVFELRATDASQWLVFPATSAVSALFATTLKVQGVAGAASPFRLVGANAGAPTSGTFVVNDLILDTITGTFWRCTAAGSPGTWAPPVYAAATPITATVSSSLYVPTIQG